MSKGNKKYNKTKYEDEEAALVNTPPLLMLSSMAKLQTDHAMDKKVEALRRQASALGFEIVERKKTNQKKSSNGSNGHKADDFLQECLSLNKKEVSAAATLAALPTKTDSGHERTKGDICKEIATRSAVIVRHDKKVEHKKEQVEISDLGEKAKAKNIRLKIAEAARATKRWAAKIALDAKQRKVERDRKAREEQEKEGEEEKEEDGSDMDKQEEEALRKRYEKMKKPELQQYAKKYGIATEKTRKKGTKREKHEHSAKTTAMLVEDLMDLFLARRKRTAARV